MPENIPLKALVSGAIDTWGTINVGLFEWLLYGVGASVASPEFRKVADPVVENNTFDAFDIKTIAEGIQVPSFLRHVRLVYWTFVREIDYARKDRCETSLLSRIEHESVHYYVKPDLRELRQT